MNRAFSSQKTQIVPSDSSKNIIETNIIDRIAEFNLIISHNFETSAKTYTNPQKCRKVASSLFKCNYHVAPGKRSWRLLFASCLVKSGG